MRDGDEGRWHRGIARGAPYHHRMPVSHLSDSKLEEVLVR